ncbi:hypothetical protein IC232_03975 [Microvirga sp. BT688]|uniref:hypothetical protein n=1 Tax=Microvirga sp. TaxID=1873136 RepID=UPI00168715BB|nr:hypothetical protein [Microvirga sp.]MBD2745850.1 hypothetical protein [Microvirga sp.]
MIFLIAIFVPPIALVVRDAKYDAIASLVMLCLGILLVPALLPLLWVAGIVHSYAVIFRQDADRRTQDLVAAVQGRQLAPAPASSPATDHVTPHQVALNGQV